VKASVFLPVLLTTNSKNSSRAVGNYKHCVYFYVDSSAHVKKSETELQALKNTNTRLTTALQESIANADHWQKQIAMYREENERYKRRVHKSDVSIQSFILLRTY